MAEELRVLAQCYHRFPKDQKQDVNDYLDSSQEHR